MTSTLPNTAIPQFITIKDIVMTTKLSRQTIWRKLKNGEIPHKRLGPRVLIPIAFLTSLEREAL